MNPGPLSEIEAAETARRRFGVEGVARLLRSEREQTFHIDAPTGDYVLKIAHPADDPAIADLQSRALAHIAEADPALPVPRVIAPLDGRAGGVRLLTWLAGTMLHAAPPSAAQRANLGRVHARLGEALVGFVHPAAGRELRWDLMRAAAQRPLVEQVADPALRALAGQALETFAEIRPRLARFRSQVIHNDLNPHNVVVAADDPDRITGILDFGDMVRAPLVCDVAVAAAYQLSDGRHALASAADYVGAYHRVVPLSDEELSLLPALIATRMAMTVVITEWRAARHPENRDYILRNHPSAAAGLKALAMVGPGRAAAALRAACQKEDA